METIIETAKFIGLAIIAYFLLSVILAFYGEYFKIFSIKRALENSF